VSDVGVLDKVMAVLSTFPDGSTSLQPPAVADRLDLSPATVYRLMKAMAEHGLLDQDDRGYRLGVTLLHLGARVSDALDVRRAAHPHLEWLRDTTGENAELHRRHGITRVPIDVVHSANNLRPLGQVGVPLPLSGGASAKVLLAWLPAEEQLALATASHEHWGSAADFDADAFVRELDRTRELGHAVSDGERETGVAAVAAPVHDHTGAVVAAIVVAGPSFRLMRSEDLATAVDAATEAAARTSASLGHPAPAPDGNEENEEVAHA
jgi:DNA-binding IclR family transcriptional regulator